MREIEKWNLITCEERVQIRIKMFWNDSVRTWDMRANQSMFLVWAWVSPDRKLAQAPKVPRDKTKWLQSDKIAMSAPAEFSGPSLDDSEKDFSDLKDLPG